MSASARATNASRWWRSNCSQVMNVVGSRTRSRNSTPSRWSSSCWKVPAVRPSRTSSCSAPSRSRRRTRTRTWRSTSPRRSGHRQAALVDRRGLVVERLDHRVDDHGQRDRRLVRVARVVVDLDDGDPQQRADLVGREPGAAGGAHRLDHVVDQALDLGRGELLGRRSRGRARAARGRRR